MKDSIILGLLQNTAILLSFAMLYENVWIKNEEIKSRLAKIITGIILGGIGVALMFTPWAYVPGIYFDTRSVMLSISGLFFGPIPTIIAMLTCGLVRLSIGGDGIWMGLAVIISSGTIGLLWRRFRPFWRIHHHHYELLAMGLLVHIVMSACTLLLPSEKTFQTFKTIAIPLLFIYAPATMLLGLLMLKQSRNWQNRLIKVKLKESERRLNQILESGNIVSLLLDKKGNIQFCNKYFLHITGYSFSEIVGKNWFDLFIASDLKRKLSQIFFNGIQNNNVIKNYENKILAKNGETLFISWYNISLQSDSDEVTGTASIGVNITDSKVYENKLEEKSSEIKLQNQQYKKLNEELLVAKDKAEESDHLKSAFLNNISHEIRTPFNGILGFLSIIQNDDIISSERDRYISIINKSAYRLMNTINDIVEISQIQAGQMKLTASDININRMSNELFSRFKPDAEMKGLSFLLNNTLADIDCNVKVDSKKLNLVLSGLINNAIKFTNEGEIEFGYRLKRHQLKGENVISKIVTENVVALESNAEQSELEFYVRDTGIGIPENKLHDIYERFMQADVSNTRQFEGSGLGLSIAKAYVEMLGGNIWVESEEGIGSTFYFTIPYEIQFYVHDNSKNLVSFDHSKKQIKNLKILIVEDDETSEIFISMVVKPYSKEILRAKTGLEAVEICRNNPDIDLIIMDIKMPEMDGYEATRQIRKFNAYVIIIAQTAFALSGDSKKAISAGCNDYIAKPFSIAALTTMIKKHF